MQGQCAADGNVWDRNGVFLCANIKPVGYVDVLEASRLYVETFNPPLAPTSPQHSSLGDDHALHMTPLIGLEVQLSR